MHRFKNHLKQPWQTLDSKSYLSIHQSIALFVSLSLSLSFYLLATELPSSELTSHHLRQGVIAMHGDR